MTMIKVFLASLLTVASLSLSAEGFFNNIFNTVKSIATNEISISNVNIVEDRYYDDTLCEYGYGGDDSLNCRNYRGKVTNNSRDETIDEIDLYFEILECNTNCNNCNIIDEAFETITVDIPPNQSRYFEIMVRYRSYNKNPTFCFTRKIKSVRAK